MALGNAPDRGESTPGPWFTAGYGGRCASCGDGFTEGDTIRADGAGGFECEGCDEAGHPNRREGFHRPQTDTESMGY